MHAAKGGELCHMHDDAHRPQRQAAAAKGLFVQREQTWARHERKVRTIYIDAWRSAREHGSFVT